MVDRTWYTLIVLLTVHTMIQLMRTICYRQRLMSFIFCSFVLLLAPLHLMQFHLLATSIQVLRRASVKWWLLYLLSDFDLSGRTSYLFAWQFACATVKQINQCGGEGFLDTLVALVQLECAIPAAVPGEPLVLPQQQD